MRCEPSVSRLATFRASNGRRARTFTALTSAYVPKRDGYQQVVPLKVAHNDTTRWKTSESDSCVSPPVVAGPAPLSHSTQQAGALGTTPGDRSPRLQSIPCSRLLLLAPPYAVAAIGPALGAPSEASPDAVPAPVAVRREPACRRTSASGASGTIAKNTVTHSALRLSSSWMSRTVGARIATMMKAARAPTTGRLAQLAITT